MSSKLLAYNAAAYPAGPPPMMVNFFKLPLSR